jgi:hypothetical protein
VMGNGLECSTVLVFPPGKSLHASLCASKLFGFAAAYLACVDDRAAESGSKRAASACPGKLTELKVCDSGGGWVRLTPEVGDDDMARFVAMHSTSRFFSRPLDRVCASLGGVHNRRKAEDHMFAGVVVIVSPEFGR